MATLYCARCLTSFEGDPTTCPNLGCGAHAPHSGWGVLLGPGDLLDRHYVIERCLAVGGAGLTYLARETDAAGAPTGPKLAIKVLYSARAAGPFLRRLSNEAQILQELAHDNIVQLRGFVHRAGQEPYLVTLFEEGGSLAQHVARVGPLAPSVAVGVLRQILRALDVAHQAGVVHRDLKPDNVLLSTRVGVDELPHCRVADFGIAKVSGGMGAALTRLGAFVGTPEYAAPEQFAGVPPTPPTDVFAAGGLLVFLLTGRPPVTFTHRTDIEQSHDELLEQLPPVLDPEQIRATPAEIAQLQEVIGHMVAPRAEDRWTIRQTLTALSPLLESFPSAPPRPLGTIEADAGITFGLEPTDEAPMAIAEGQPPRPDAPPAPPPSIVGVAPDAPPLPPQTAPVSREWVDAARAEVGLPPLEAVGSEPSGASTPESASLLTATEPFTPARGAISAPPLPSPGRIGAVGPPPLPSEHGGPPPIEAGALEADTAPEVSLSVPPPLTIPPPLPSDALVSISDPPPLPGAEVDPPAEAVSAEVVVEITEVRSAASIGQDFGAEVLDEADQVTEAEFPDLPVVDPPAAAPDVPPPLPQPDPPPLPGSAPSPLPGSEPRAEEADTEAAPPPEPLSTLHPPVPEAQEPTRETISPPEEVEPRSTGASFAEPPQPPPFVPSLPPAAPPTPLVVVQQPAPPPPEPPRRRTSVFGCMGVSLLGMIVVGVTSTLAAGLLVLAVAWGLGYLGEIAVVTPPVVVEDSLERRFDAADPLPEAMKRKLQQAVSVKGPGLVRSCGSGSRVRAQLLVDSSGKVLYAKVVDAGGLEADCVRKGLEKIRASGVSKEGRAPVMLKP